MTNLILIGFKNSGKTSVGKLLAEKLNKGFLDADDLISKEYDKLNHLLLNSRDIVLKHGEAYFRSLEKKIIVNLEKNNIKNTIIATGGGCILNSENISCLKKIGKLIYLSTPYQTLKSRILSQAVLPSYLNSEEPEKSFEQIYKKRQNIYSTVADFEIFTENKSIAEIANKLIENKEIIYD